MSILLSEDFTFIVQGITGREAVNLTKECLDYGSKVVGGVTPGRKGREVHGVPVFDTVEQAVADHGAPIDGSVVTVPPAFTKDAVFEAIENGIKLIVVVTERIPRRDVAEMVELANLRGARIIGPNCLGIIAPGVAKMGGIGGPAKDAAKAYEPGSIGVMSRSGGMTTEISSTLTAAGLGVSTAVSIGGDAIIGSTYAELMPLFEEDEQTEAIVIYTEPGGRMEAELVDWREVDDRPGRRHTKRHAAVPDGRPGIARRGGRCRGPQSGDARRQEDRHERRARSSTEFVHGRVRTSSTITPPPFSRLRPMARVTERIEQALEREAPSWGIRPVPPEHRLLGSLDFAVLWGDLSIGLLVLLTGALLVPALGLPTAIVAIVVGSVIGCVPLALVGLAGAREGVPGMVLFRPVLGVRGSYLPSVLNIVAAHRMDRDSSSGRWRWSRTRCRSGCSASRTTGSGSPSSRCVCTLLALGGPILVIRRWLERFGAWVVAAVGGRGSRSGCSRRRTWRHLARARDREGSASGWPLTW